MIPPTLPYLSRYSSIYIYDSGLDIFRTLNVSDFSGLSKTSAIAVDSATYSPNYASGEFAPVAIDRSSGGILSHIRALNLSTDAVTTAGNVAHDGVDVGGPIKVGGKGILTESGPTSVSSNDRVDAWFDLQGRQIVKAGGKDIYTAVSSSARSVAVTGTAYTFGHAKGMCAWLNVTAATPPVNLNLVVEGQNPVAGTYVELYRFATVTGVSNNMYRIYPGITELTGYNYNSIIPRGFRHVVLHSGSNSATYSVGMDVLH